MTAAARWFTRAAMVLLAAAAPAAAQSASETGGRLDIGGSVSWTASAPLGSASASLTPNLGQPAYTLFTASAEAGRVFGGDVRVGYRPWPAVAISASTGVAHVPVNVSIAGDAESPANTAFTGEILLQWSLEGRLDCEVRGLRFAHGRARPFVLASAGVIRQWHEDHVTHESGRIYQAGGGIAWTLADRPRSLVSRWSLVAEIRVARITGGYHWGTAARTSPAFGAGVVTAWGRR
ncbi:MAG: hypothetical protein NTY02_07720 [Acidobacteria bacterium]|nr:hypothetical protein [Acidobacteriota bacterium]